MMAIFWCDYQHYSNTVSLLILVAELNMTNLIDDLVTVVDKWYLIGVKLEIKPSVLKVFEQQYNNNSRRCLAEMLQYWLDGNAPTCVKWETIIAVLRSPLLDEAGFAEKIYKDNQLQQAASECVSQGTATPGNIGCLAIQI